MIKSELFSKKSKNWNTAKNKIVAKKSEILKKQRNFAEKELKRAKILTKNCNILQGKIIFSKFIKSWIK